MFYTFSQIIFDLGMTLGIGSSTFALTFYINALEDSVIDDSEKRFMRVVFRVLRIGMVLIFMSLVGFLIAGGASEFMNHLSQWFLLGIITLNAILMTRKIMPMRLGPVLAGGTWYSFFLVSNTPIGDFGTLTQLIIYGGWLIVFYVVYQWLVKKFAFRTKGAATN